MSISSEQLFAMDYILGFALLWLVMDHICLSFDIFI